jgi:hypothetical protein
MRLMMLSEPAIARLVADPNRLAVASRTAATSRISVRAATPYPPRRCAAEHDLIQAIEQNAKATTDIGAVQSRMVSDCDRFKP